MSSWPAVSGIKLVKSLEKIGYRVVRQRGSHFRLHYESRRPVTVPNYKTISRGLIRKIIRDASISVEEFLELLK